VSRMELRRLAGKIKPTSYKTATDYLAAVYKQLKDSLGDYSYIRFTEDLGFGACNALYLIISGTRPLTLKGAQKIISALDITGVQRKYFLEMVQAARSKDLGEREQSFERLVELKSQALVKTLDKSQLEFFSHWYHGAILELLGLEGAEDDPQWISKRLMPSVPLRTVTSSLLFLKKIGLLAFDEERQRLYPTKESITTGSEVYGLAIMRYHQQMIALGRDALLDVAPMERDITASTFAIPAERMGEFKARIQNFRKELREFAATLENPDEVVQINIQLFPLARTSTRSKAK
jgi:uncharacterized protein (TIGR02147 family)